CLSNLGCIRLADRAALTADGRRVRRVPICAVRKCGRARVTDIYQRLHQRNGCGAETGRHERRRAGLGLARPAADRGAHTGTESHRRTSEELRGFYSGRCAGAAESYGEYWAALRSIATSERHTPSDGFDRLQYGALAGRDICHRQAGRLQSDAVRVRARWLSRWLRLYQLEELQPTAGRGVVARLAHSDSGGRRHLLRHAGRQYPAETGADFAHHVCPDFDL